MKRATSAGRLLAVSVLFIFLAIVGPALLGLLNRAGQAGGAL